MFSTTPNRKSAAPIWLKAIIACNLSACISVVASGQTMVQSAADAEKKRVMEKVFIACPGKDAYYLGFITSSANACGEQESRAPFPYNQQPDCFGLMEFKNAEFGWVRERPTPADVENEIWKGFVTMKYSMFRVRHVYGGRWRPWEAWQDMPAGMLTSKGEGLLIERILNQKGQWSREAGPDVSRIPDFMRLAVSVSGADPHADMALDGMIKYKPACSDILNDAPHGGVQPRPHRTTDTYAETLEIIKQNKGNGMPDPLALSTSVFNRYDGLPVCYSIDANGQCKPSGETVTVPGDLAVPIGFWEGGSPQSFGHRCQGTSRTGRQSPLSLEVTLKSTGQNRVISCRVASTLDLRREQLIGAGVELGQGEAARRSWGGRR